MKEEARRKKRAREIVAQRFRLFIHALLSQFTRKPEELWRQVEEPIKSEPKDVMRS